MRDLYKKKCLYLPGRELNQLEISTLIHTVTGQSENQEVAHSSESTVTTEDIPNLPG